MPKDESTPKNMDASEENTRNSASAEHENDQEPKVHKLKTAQKDAPAEDAELGADGLVNDLRDQLKQREDQYKYLYAEFENFKKRTAREKTETRKFGWEPIARELVMVIDNLDRALSFVPKDSDNSLVQGIEMVRKQFLDTLEKNGVEKIVTENKEFDPNVHEAVAQEPSESVKENYIIRDESTGYLFHGRLLRPSRVVISQGKR